jgi:hypothetical protein
LKSIPNKSAAHDAIEAVARDSYGRLVAYIASCVRTLRLMSLRAATARPTDAPIRHCVSIFSSERPVVWFDRDLIERTSGV